MNKTARILLAVLVVTSFAACKKKEVVKTETETSPPASTDTTTRGTTTQGAFTEADLDTNPCLRQRVVYFDFDRSEVRPEAQATLGCHGKYLRDRPSARVTLEGHADERGTREYNLGLGERRGNAVMAAIGSASQVSVVSYGEERPTCADSSEDCWQRNRRVEIVYTVK